MKATQIATFAIKEGTVQIPFTTKTDNMVTTFFNFLKEESTQKDQTDIVPIYENKENWRYTHLGYYLSKNNSKVLIPMNLSNITLDELITCVHGKLTIYKQTDLTPEMLHEMNKSIERCQKND